eukprot:g1739.t1
MADAVFLQFCTHAQGLSTYTETKAFTESGGVRQLVTLCRTSKNLTLVVNAIAALGCVLCTTPEAVSAVLEEEGVKALIQVTLHAIRTLECGKDGVDVVGVVMSVDKRKDADILVHILESALFALGGLAEQSELACEQIFNFDREQNFLAALMRCVGAKQTSHLPLPSSLPSEVARHALWVMESVLRTQAKKPFHRSAVPALLQRDTGGLERLVELCGAQGDDDDDDCCDRSHAKGGHPHKQHGAFLRQAAASVLCSSLRIMTYTKQSMANNALRREIVGRLSMIRTIEALKSAQECLWKKYDMDDVLEDESWLPLKGEEVEAMLGDDGSWRLGVVVMAPKHNRWYHIYDKTSQRLVRKIPSTHVRNPKSMQRVRSESKSSEVTTGTAKARDASNATENPPSAAIARLLCEIANTIRWLESQTPLWQRGGCRAILFSRLLSRRSFRDSYAALRAGEAATDDEEEEVRMAEEKESKREGGRAASRSTSRERGGGDKKKTNAPPSAAAILTMPLFAASQTTTLGALAGLSAMEAQLLKRRINLDNASTLDPNLSLAHVRGALSDFFEARPGERANSLIVVCYSGKAQLATGDWVLGDGTLFTYKDLMSSWTASSVRQRGAILMLILDSCGSGAWARKLRKEGRLDVAVQACCLPGQQSEENLFWKRWVVLQATGGQHGDLASALAATKSNCVVSATSSRASSPKREEGSPLVAADDNLFDLPAPADDDDEDDTGSVEVHDEEGEGASGSKGNICQDFVHGRCRRGSQCEHAHTEDEFLAAVAIDNTKQREEHYAMQPVVYVPWSVSEAPYVELLGSHGKTHRIHLLT